MSDDPVSIADNAAADLNELREVIHRLRRERERLTFERDAAEIGYRQQLMELCRTAAQGRAERGDLSDAIAWLDKLVAIAHQARQQPRLAVTELDSAADERRLSLLRFIQRACGAEPPFPAGRRDRRILVATAVCNRQEADLVNRVLWPCLHSEGNLPALTRRGEVVLQVFTTAFVKPFLSRSPSLDRLAKLCNLEFVLFPNTIVPERARRWQLGQEMALVSLRQAHAAQADLIVLRPDMVLSDHVLKTVLERADAGAEAMFTVLLGLDEREVMPLLLTQREENQGLSLDARSLADLALQKLSRRTLAYIVAGENNRYFPDTPQLIWPREDGLIIRAAEQYPLFLAYSAVCRGEALPWTELGTKLAGSLLREPFATTHVNKNLENCGVYLLEETTHTAVAPSFFHPRSFAERFWRRSGRFERWMFDHRVHLHGSHEIPYRSVNDAELGEQERLVEEALFLYQPAAGLGDEMATAVAPGRKLLPNSAMIEAAPHFAGLARLGEAQLIPWTQSAVVKLEAGIYALNIGETVVSEGNLDGIGVPPILICSIETEGSDPVQITNAAPTSSAWNGGRGGTVMIKAAEAGSTILITAYGLRDMAPMIDIRRIEPAGDLADEAPTPPVRKPRKKQIQTERPAEAKMSWPSDRTRRDHTPAAAEPQSDQGVLTSDRVLRPPQQRKAPRQLQSSTKPVIKSDLPVPPNGQMLLKALMVTPEMLQSAGRVSVPVAPWRALLSILISEFPFDEDFYATTYADLAEAKASGLISDLRMHFLSHGYLEGRLSSYPNVDERFYLGLYPDVAQMVSGGDKLAAVEHYIHGGAEEGRFPNEEEMEVFTQWRQIQSSEASRQTVSDIRLPVNGRVLLDALMLTWEMLRSLPKLPLSAPALRALLELLVAAQPFDEDFYAMTYPDIAEAKSAGVIASPWLHFRQIGYFQGRLGVWPEVDETFYKEKYPDVALAIANGEIQSGLVHYVNFGATEGRFANIEQARAVGRWQEILRNYERAEHGSPAAYRSAW